MINNSVFETQVSRLLWKAFNEAMQIIIYYHKGNPENHVKSKLLYIEGILAEIRKIEGNSSTDAGAVGFGKDVKGAQNSKLVGEK